MRQVRLCDLTVATVGRRRFGVRLRDTVFGSVAVYQCQVCRRHLQAVSAVMDRGASMNDLIEFRRALLSERGSGGQRHGNSRNKGKFFDVSYSL